MQQRRQKGDGRPRKRLTCLQNQASSSVIAFLASSMPHADATQQQHQQHQQPMMNMMICEGTTAPAAFLDPTSFTTKQQQHHNARHVRPLYHQARGSQGKSTPTQDARRTSPVRPLPSSAAGLLLPMAPPAGNGGLTTSSSSSSNNSNSRIASAPTAANDLLPSALRNGNVQAAANSPAGGAVRFQVQQQHRRQQQQQKQTGGSGLSSTRGEQQQQQQEQQPAPNGDRNGARTAAVSPAAQTTSTATTLPRQRPVAPAQLPGHLEHLIGQGEWRKAVAAFERARRREAALLAVAAATAAKNPRALLSRGAYNQALAAYATGRDGHSALELLRAMRKAGGRLAPSRSSFNICLNACRHGRQRDKVMSVLELMVQDGIPPSGKSYSSALQACAKDGNVPDARKMLGWMWTSPDLEGGVKGLRPTTWGYNCAMEACARSGDWGSAVELMDEMRTRGLSHDAFTYGAALEACGRTGNWQKAEAIVEQMADAYTESLEGANGSGDDDAGGGVFAHSGKKSSLSPTAVHCNALLQAYSRGKRVDKALRLLDEMLAVAPALPSSATPPPVLSAAAAAAPEENLVSTRVSLEPPPPPVTMAAAEALAAELTGSDPVKDEEEFSSGSGSSSSSTSYIGTQGLAEIHSRPHPPLDEGESSPRANSEASPPPPPPPLSSPASASAKIGKEESTADDGGEGSRDDDDNDDRSALLRWDPRLPLPRPDAVSFGTVIDGCSRARLADEAVCLLKVMGEERIGGTAPIAGGGGGGSEMWRSGGGGGSGGGSGDTPLLPPNVHCLTAAITACGRANRLELAIAVLREAAVLEDAWLDEQVRLLRRQQEDDARGKSSPARPAAAWEWEVVAGPAEVSPTPDRRRRRQQNQPPGEDTSPVVDSGTSSTTILKGRGVEADAGIAASGGRSSVNETAKFNSGKLAGGEDAEATIDGDKSATAGAVAAWDGSETSTAEGPLRARSSLQPAFNAAINACVKAGSHGEARLLMRDMGERGLRPGREAFNSLLVACSTSYEAMNILAEMERARVAPDVASYTAAIGACSRGGDLPAALGLFEAMRRPSPPGAAAAAARVVEPGTGDGGAGGRAATVRAAPMADAQAYGAAAAACARGLDHRGALRLLGEMREARLRPGRPMFGAVIDACARRGKWEEATALLEEMTASGVAPSLRHYSSAIFACALGENPGKGLELLSVMRKKRVSPNSTCVNAAIHGFALLGDWEKSLEILSNMERTYHVVPDSVSYNTAMKACFRSGQNQAGLALFDRMRSYPPNPPRSGGGGSGGGEKASAASHSTKRHPRTFLRVSLPNGGGAAAMVQPAAPAAPARQRQSARDAGADSADSVEKSGGEVVGGAVACRERAGVAGGEGISTAHPRSAVAATEGAEVSAAVGAGKGKGQGGRSAFRASSPPRPDTASYNTVIAAVASAWGWGGRGQATALLREMGVRGLQPDRFTLKAMEKAGGEVEEAAADVCR